MTESIVELSHHDEARALFGQRDENLRKLCLQTGAQVVLRGNQVRISGEEVQVRKCQDTLQQWRNILQHTQELTPGDVAVSLQDSAVEADSPAVQDSAAPVTHAAANTESEIQDTSFGMKSMLHTDSHQSRPSNSSPSGNGSAGDWQPGGRAVAEMRSGRDRVGQIRPKTEGQRAYMEAMRKHELVFCDGPAGSGKTYLAVAMALEALRSEQVRKIVLVRPAVEAGEKLGFLPGDILAKVNPFLRPLLDAVHDMLDYEQVRRYMANDVIEIVPFAFMRGRTLNDTFMILDEAQNTTVTQMKMFLTRMGMNSRIVVAGDGTQNDLERGVESGLRDGIRRLARIPGVAIMKLTGQDIVRHRLVREIVSAYEADSIQQA